MARQGWLDKEGWTLTGMAGTLTGMAGKGRLAREGWTGMAGQGWLDTDSDGWKELARQGRAGQGWLGREGLQLTRMTGKVWLDKNG
jgi:hypothetical protein